MSNSILTLIDDVLILETTTTFTIYVVGLVTKDGQQNFKDSTKHDNVKTLAAALACAETLVSPGHRIFLLNIDTGIWSEGMPRT